MYLNFFLCIIFIFPSIAFFTIMERKLLGIFHIRVGPEKVGLMGMFQPFSDAIKLISKKNIFMSKLNIILFNSSPLILILMFLLMIFFLPIKKENNIIMNNFLMLFLIISLTIFPLFWGSFFSSCKFSIIASKRLITQCISYEIGLMTFFVCMIPISMKINFLLNLNLIKMFNFINLIILLLIYILVLCESSRIPFDFIEGESELVSGFNTEFSSLYFSLFFLFEYGMMLFFSLMVSLMYNFFLSVFLMYMYINIRSSFPRMRYDQMMMLMWKYFYMVLFSILFIMKINSNL